ncbi:MAG: cell division protein FtsA [Chthoniobacterales bacterium]
MAKTILHVGLEIGTSKVAAVIAETRSDGLLRIIGTGESPSRGVRKGEIVDIGKITLCLNDAVSEAEEKADREIGDVTAAVTGAHLDSLNNRGGIQIPDDRDEIEDEDIQEVEQSALDVTIPTGNVFLHTMVQRYYVDGQEGVASPLGMVGRKLEAEFHIVHGTKTRIQNNLRCIREANLRPATVVMSAVASAQAVSEQADRDSGVLVIDIGGGVTDYILFRDGSVRHSGVLAVGGDHITNDISIGLRVPTKLAEKLKVEHAEVSPASLSARGTVEVEDTTFAGGHVERRVLNMVAEARVRELFALLKRRLNFERHAQFVGAGVLITGGTADLKGIASLASDVFGVPAHVALPKPIMGPSSLFESPRFSTALGLVLYAQALQEAQEDTSIIDIVRTKILRFIPGL